MRRRHLQTLGLCCTPLGCSGVFHQPPSRALQQLADTSNMPNPAKLLTPSAPSPLTFSALFSPLLHGARHGRQLPQLPQLPLQTHLWKPVSTPANANSRGAHSSGSPHENAPHIPLTHPAPRAPRDFFPLRHILKRVAETGLDKRREMLARLSSTGNEPRPRPPVTSCTVLLC